MHEEEIEELKKFQDNGTFRKELLIQLGKINEHLLELSKQIKNANH